jgi:hypothetical protein
MTLPVTRAVVLSALLLSGAVLVGCTNPDASGPLEATSSSASPQSPGEPPAPPPPSPSGQAPSGAQPTPQRALAAFAARYVNWSYRTLAANQRGLAAMSLGAARASELQAAAASTADATLARGRISNHGQVVSVALDRASPGTWVIVTDEQTSGAGEYEGLKPSYHVTLARLANVAGGYAVAEWLPQS